MSPVLLLVLAGAVGFVALAAVAGVVWFVNRDRPPPTPAAADAPGAAILKTDATLNVNRVVHVVDADEDLQGLLLYVAGRLVSQGDHERAAAVFSVANQAPPPRGPEAPRP